MTAVVHTRLRRELEGLEGPTRRVRSYFSRRCMLGVCATVLVLFAGIAEAQPSCDVRKEILDLVLAVERYGAFAAEAATLRRVSVSDAVKAGIEAEVQKTRAYYLCRSTLIVEGSAERRLMGLLSKRVHGLSMRLLGTAGEDPSVKAGHDATLELIDAAQNYFNVRPLSMSAKEKR